MNIGIVVGEFNSDMTMEMLEIAKHRAMSMDSEVIKVIKVAGVFDMPLAVKTLLQKEDIDAVACLAVVIQGKTDHDLVITQSTTNLIAQLSLEFNKPVSSGIIGPRVSRDHAEVRKQGYAERAIEALITMNKNLNE